MFKLLIIYCLLIFNILGCEKSNNSEEILNVKTYEMATLEFTDTKLEETYEGDIDGETVFLAKSSDNELLFLVPSISEGRHTLNFALGQYELNVTISKDNSTSFSDVYTKIDSSIELIDTPSSSPEIREAIDNLKIERNKLISIIDSLSEEEKLALNQFISSNSDFYDIELKGSTSQPILSSDVIENLKEIKEEVGATISAIDISTNHIMLLSAAALSLIYVYHKKDISLKEIIKDIASLNLTRLRAIIALPSVTLVIKVTAVALISVIIYRTAQLINLKAKLEKILLENKILDFFSDLTTANESFIFESEKVVTSNVSLVWRSLQAIDTSLGSPFIEFIQSLKKLNFAISKIPSLLGFSKIKYQNNYTAFEYPLESMDLYIKDNSKVSFTIENKKVVFHNDSQEDEDFTLSISYEVEGYKISKDFPAKVTKRSSACGLTGTIEERISDCSRHNLNEPGHSLVRILPEETKLWRSNNTGLIWGRISESLPYLEAATACDSSRAELSNINVSWRFTSKDDISSDIEFVQDVIGGYLWTSANEVCQGAPDYMCTWFLGTSGNWIYGSYNNSTAGVACVGEGI